MNIGEAHLNVRSASFLKFLLLFRILIFSNGAGGICALILLAQGGSVRQYNGEPISLSSNTGNADRRDAPIIFKLCFADFFRVRSAITISAGCIGAPLVWRIIRKMNGFSAPHDLIVLIYLSLYRQDEIIQHSLVTFGF
jgi:hypothetical protein